jgi:spore coat polysaccharide biosynthesis protein SpsF
MKNKKVVAIIQARMGSTRLPGKVLMDIIGKPMLWHVIERVKRCKKVDSIVVATTIREEDKAVTDLSKKCGVKSFAGSINDVLDRYYQAAKKFSADIIVRITADCPLINPNTIDKIVSLCVKEDADYICGHPDFPSIEHGMEVMSFSTLEKVKNIAIKDYQKEHVTIYIRENPELFKIVVNIPKIIFQRKDMRLTVDTKEDLKLMKEIYDRLYTENEIIDVENVVRLLINNPELKKINTKIEMSNINKYASSQTLKRKILKSLTKKENNEEKIFKIVFRCDASPDVGLGHIIRCLAVAKELQKQNHIIFATIKDGTNSHIKDKNLEMFFKERNETEENFLKRLCSMLYPEVMVIDKKYLYSSAFINNLKQNTNKIIMIDNICEGLSECDEIVFPNAHLDKSFLKKYLSEKQINQVKTGLEYVILRGEILALKDKITNNFHNPPNIVVTTGGTDPEGVLLKLIPWLKEMKLKANILILIGQAFKYKNGLEKLIINLPDNFQVLPYSMKELLKADIVICTFGISIYEMIYLQIPTICISHSRENARSAKILEERYGVIKDVGFVENVNQQVLFPAINNLLKDKTHYKNIIKKCSNLIDEKGAKRIGKIIVGGKYV